MERVPDSPTPTLGGDTPKFNFNFKRKNQVQVSGFGCAKSIHILTNLAWKVSKLELEVDSCA